MAYQWGETCDGWTIEQRYKLKMGYAESPDVDIALEFRHLGSRRTGCTIASTRSETRNGKPIEEEIRGEAKLDGPGQGRRRRLREAEAARP